MDLYLLVFEWISIYLYLNGPLFTCFLMDLYLLVFEWTYICLYLNGPLFTCI